jgi:ariadne-1
VVAFCGDGTKAKDVSCKRCDSSFCFLCGDKPHLPVSCKLWRKYQTSVGRLDQREEEVEKKTIACPNCGVGITKNGGCNHMTCSQCFHEFCWICLSENWQDHVCNVFDGLDDMDDIPRIQFFRRRVNLHHDSAQAARRLLDEFEMHARHLSLESPFCQDEDLYIIKGGLEAIVHGREYLANTYIAAYGMTNVEGGYRLGFEAHQSQLQVFVEQLSFLTENIPNLCKMNNEQDFRVRIRGIQFCTIAVTGYTRRFQSFIERNSL